MDYGDRSEFDLFSREPGNVLPRGDRGASDWVCPCDECVPLLALSTSEFVQIVGDKEYSHHYEPDCCDGSNERP